MRTPISVQIIAVPIACADGVRDTWREIAGWASEQLGKRFGEAVKVQYFDLFAADCPTLPADSQLPLVLVAGEVISSGGKISVPDIRRKIETLLEQESV